MDSKINEEIKNSKLDIIIETEKKLAEYEKAYSKIRENVVLKYAKNISLFIVDVFLSILAILYLVSIVYVLINSEILNEPMTIWEAIFGCLFLAAILLLFGKTIRSNVKKRNTIYSLSKLLEDIIGYTRKNVDEDKRKYEYLIDQTAELKNKENNPK